MANVVMAPPKNVKEDPYAVAARQQALADMLQQRATQGQQRPTARTSTAAALNGVSDIVNQLGAIYGGQKAGQMKAEADKTTSTSNRALIQAMMQGKGMQVDGLDAANPGFTTPGKLDPAANDLSQALSGVDPMAVKGMLAKTMYERAMPDPGEVADRELKRTLAEQAAADRQAALEERAATRQQRLVELETRLADSRTQAADRAALQREIAQMRNENALELQRMRQGAATDKVDAAAAAKEAPKEAAKQTLSGQIASIRDMYTQLGEAGGITDTSKPASDNISAAARSSAVGQFAGKVFGTKEQSLRNQIQQARPILLQQIKAATGMSAQQMNSNVELKLFLEAATDPKLDLQANMKALDGLEAMVNGGPAAAAPPPAAAPAVNSPPPEALKEGQVTTFANGQSWTLKGGKAERVK